MAAPATAVADTIKYAQTSHPTTTAQAPGSNPLLEYFGQPNRPIQTDAFEDATFTHYQLPKYYEGSSDFLSRRVTGLFLEPGQDWYTFNGLTWAEGKNIHLDWNELTFNRTIVPRVPEEAPPRIVTISTKARKAKMVRHAQGLLLEHGFQNTPQGREMYMIQLQGIASDVQETQNFDVLSAYVTCHDQDRDWQDHHGLSKVPIDQVRQREVYYWACVQTEEHGLKKYIDDVVMSIRRNGDALNGLALPPKIIKYVQYKPENTTFSMSGEKGLQAFKGPEAYSNLNGLQVFKTRMFDIQGHDFEHDVLTRIQRIAEWYHAVCPSSGRSHQNYATSQRAISIFDGSIDNFNEITLKQMIEADPRFDADGFVRMFDDKDLKGKTDMWIHRGANNGGDAKPVHYIGELPEAFIDSEWFRNCAALVASKDGLTATMKAYSGASDVTLGALPLFVVGGTATISGREGAELMGAVLREAGVDDTHVATAQASLQQHYDKSVPVATTAQDALQLIHSGLDDQHKKTKSADIKEKVASTKASLNALADRIDGLQQAYSSRYTQKTRATSSAAAGGSSLDFANAVPYSAKLGDLKGKAVADPLTSYRSAMPEEVKTQHATKTVSEYLALTTGQAHLPAHLESFYMNAAYPEWMLRGGAGGGSSSSVYNRGAPSASIGAPSFVQFASAGSSRAHTAMVGGSNINGAQYSAGGRTFTDVSKQDTPLNKHYENAKTPPSWYDVSGEEPEKTRKVAKYEAALKVVLMLIPNKYTFLKLCDNNLPVPLNYILFRPRMTFRMASGIAFSQGGATGHSYYMHPDFQLGNDVVTKIHFGHFSYYSKSVVTNNRNVVIMPNIFTQGYISGANCRFMRLDAGQSLAAYKEDDKSILAVHHPYAHKNPPNPLHISGNPRNSSMRMTKYVQSGDENARKREEALKEVGQTRCVSGCDYQTSEWYAENLQLGQIAATAAANSENPTWLRNRHTEVDCAYAGHWWSDAPDTEFGPTRTVGVPHAATGHFKTYYYQGTRQVWDGLDTYFDTSVTYRRGISAY